MAKGEQARARRGAWSSVRCAGRAPAVRARAALRVLRPRAVRRVLLVAAAALSLARPAIARELRVPLTIDRDLLREALRAQVFDGPEHSLRVADGSGCNEAVLAEPKLDSRDGQLRLESEVDASGGLALFGFCLFPLGWQGTVEVFEEPEVVPPDPIVRFRVVDSKLRAPRGERPGAAGAVWDLVKSYVQPRLAELEIDLGAPLRDLREILPLFLGRAGSERTAHVLDTLRIADAEVAGDGVRVDLRFDVEEPEEPVAPPAPERPLDSAEIAAFGAALQRVDAFTTFVVKHAGADAQLETVRAALLGVLLDERYDLVDALARPSQDASPRVRALFVASWERLAPVLRHAASSLPGGLAARYLSFIAAADALRAIDEIGPASGLDISADGLRRLARVIAPTAAEDPLAYGSGVDPELRALLGFGAPLAAPEEGPTEEPSPAGPDDAAASGAPGPTPRAAPGGVTSGPPGGETEVPPDGAIEGPPDAAIDDSPGEAMEGRPGGSAGGPPRGTREGEAAPADAPQAPDAPARTPRPDLDPGAAAPSRARPGGGAAAAGRASGALAVRPVWAPRCFSDGFVRAAGRVGRAVVSLAAALLDPTAAEAGVPAGDAAGGDDDVVRRLNRWAPSRADLDQYLPLVRGLLRAIAEARIRDDALDARLHPLFRALVPATAWQESCWRQYVKQRGRLAPLRSPAGAVGIMQVNQTVWRGFYDQGGLQRDIRYNARAGAEILSRYLREYVLDGRSARPAAELASATYAVFNGGPGQLRRVEKGAASPRERAVDRAFRDKFGRISAGDSLAVAECFGD